MKSVNHFCDILVIKKYNFFFSFSFLINIIFFFFTSKMDFYKTYHFDTKCKRISSATYLRELLYSMLTMLQTTRAPYIPHPEPKFSTKPNTSQRNSVGYQILLTWQEFHEKLLQSLDKDLISGPQRRANHLQNSIIVSTF